MGFNYFNMNINFNQQIKYSGFIFLLLVFSSPLFAGKTTVAASIKSIELLVDSSKTLGFSEIENSSGFQVVQNGYSSPNKVFNYWLRIKIKPGQVWQQKCFLVVNAGIHYDLTFYCRLKDSVVEQKAGLYNKKEVEHYYPNENFEVEPGGTAQFYVYIKARSFGAAEKFFFGLQSEKEFYQNQQTRQFTFGVFYGILLVIMLINIFYFFSLKRKAFLYYATYVFLTIVFCSYLDGIPLFGLVNTIGDYHRASINTALLSYFGFLPIMAIHYIQLNKSHSKLLKISYGYFLFVVVSIIAGFVVDSDKAYEFYFIFHNLTILFGAVLTLTIVIKGYKNNKILGRSFIVAISIVILSIVLSVFEDYGVTSFKLFYDVIKLGSLLEVIILSLALALHFRDIDRSLVKKSTELDLLSIDYEEAQEQFSHLEGRFLRSQMNPHFIFNAMSSIQNFILDNKNKMAHEYLSKFAKLIRNVLEFSRKDFIQLREEIETLSIYIQLEKLRASDKFSYTITTASDINPEKCLIPSMIIQPFIENAIVHGLFSKEGNDGMLTVYFEQKGLQLICTIEDNGIGREKSKEIRDKKEKYHRSRGMSVTKDRLEILKNSNQLDAGYSFEDLYDENRNAIGTRVVIVVPLRIDTPH